MKNYPYVTNEYGKLRRVLLHSPKHLTIQKPINVIAEKNIKTRDIDTDVACKEFYEEFVGAFKSYGVEVIEVGPHPELIFAVNTRDIGTTTPKGILLGRFTKFPRWNEHRFTEDALKEQKVPIYHRIDKGLFEGGDFMYVDDNTVLIGHGCRTNMLGVKALEFALYDSNLELIPVDFHEDYLHLDMICNVVGERVAVVYPDALPENVLALFKQKNFELITVSKEDVFLHGCNLLSIGDDVIFSHPQVPHVNEKLKALGFKVEVINMTEIMKCGGGPRCMSFPILRD